MRSKSKHILIYKEYLVLLGCILISLIFLFSNRTRQIEAIKIFTVDFMGIFRSHLNFLSRNSSLEQQNRFLRVQNTKLALENSRMREALIENERMRKLIGFKENSEYELISAKVIGRNSSGFMNYIFLDVGRKDSIKKNMPMILPGGLVGKIYHVKENHSIGQLLFDQNFRVSSKIQRSGVKGIIGWDGEQLCNMHQIPNRSDVQADDLVVSSGYSEIFPAGIFIGKVVSASDTQRDLFMNVKIKPEIDFNRLEEVLVIVGEK